jgi:dTDP-glucose 4,6-dehydratase
MTKVLITGVWGFIFSNFIRYVCYHKVKGYQWSSIDDFSSPLASFNRHSNRGIKEHQQYSCSINDIQDVDIIFQTERPDIVIHAAAQTSVDKSLKDEDLFKKTNIDGTKVIVDACIKYGVKRIIYISTDEVLGELKSENDPLWTEDSPPNPRNPYSKTKYEGEKIVVASGLNYNITRSSNNYGERQTSDKLIPHTIKCILNNQPIPLYGQGMQMRDWIYVIDNCTAILTILKDGGSNQIYNIGAGCEMTNIEMVQRICKIMGRGYDLIKHIPDPRGDAHDFRYAMDCSKLRGFGWSPMVKFKDGLAGTVQWYVENAGWALKN